MLLGRRHLIFRRRKRFSIAAQKDHQRRLWLTGSMLSVPGLEASWAACIYVSQNAEVKFANNLVWGLVFLVFGTAKSPFIKHIYFLFRQNSQWHNDSLWSVEWGRTCAKSVSVYMHILTFTLENTATAIGGINHLHEVKNIYIFKNLED